MRVRTRLYYAQDGICFYCGEEMYLPGTKKRERRHSPQKDCTQDHLFPKKGGFRFIGHPILDRNRMNIVAACKECNERKGSLDPTDEEIRKAIMLWDSILGKGAKQIRREYMERNRL